MALGKKRDESTFPRHEPTTMTETLTATGKTLRSGPFVICNGGTLGVVRNMYSSQRERPIREPGTLASDQGGATSVARFFIPSDRAPTPLASAPLHPSVSSTLRSTRSRGCRTSRGRAWRIDSARGGTYQRGQNPVFSLSGNEPPGQKSVTREKPRNVSRRREVTEDVRGSLAWLQKRCTGDHPRDTSPTACASAAGSL